MRPVAFRIRDFKSIVDTGECRLSTDGITVLAGENESGKTAILSALRDFNLPTGTHAKTSDFVPDDDYERNPSVSVRFEIDWHQLFDDLRENQVFVHPSIRYELSKTPHLWVTRDLLADTFSLDPDREQMWAETLARFDAQSEEERVAFWESVDDEDRLDEGSTWDTAHEFSEALYSHWPIFVYFSTFDDILPRNIPFSKLRKKLPPAGLQRQAAARLRRRRKSTTPLLKSFWISSS